MIENDCKAVYLLLFAVFFKLTAYTPRSTAEPGFNQMVRQSQPLWTFMGNFEPSLGN